ncbi:nitrate- and nitrite sensing domain-containing protein [Streptomyces sp. Rer75]|uniref:sensor histidine kinase n=1 Tax=Streptomyces sp. Rer75 TaxID=2750011 RepID=UPI0015CFFB78|nr:nitrate- and nitrite sensing domain-containing protein [Streptomyces sp. Rer75]QLH25764.1 nitrate- and nitrite sensing domain-containing protein [Streptomyces sp. Rer75]
MTPGRHAAEVVRGPGLWATIVQWRNWRLPVKLGAVLVVPALLAVALGVVQIQREVERANSYADMQRLVKLRSGLMPLLGSLQEERTMAAEQLRGGGGADAATMRRQVRSTDRARTALTGSTKRAPQLDGAAGNRYQDAVKAMGGLTDLREQVASGSISSWAAVNQYRTAINSLLDLDQALGSRFGEPKLSGPASALYDLEAVQEEVHLQHVTLLEAMKSGQSGQSTDMNLVRALEESDIRLQDKLGDFRAVATPAEQSMYERTVTGKLVKRRADLVRSALSGSQGNGAQQGITPPQVPTSEWNRSSETTVKLLGKVEKNLAQQLRVNSAQLQDQTSNRAGAYSVALLAVLLLAGSIGFAIGRYLLRSLTVLRSTALDVAEHRLPAAVSSIREGEKADTAVSAVPVHTTEEFGQLARAFDAVHGQAVRLASEQAALRGDLRDTLVNLSRRSQTLVDRLLRLMEQLERHEEDPDQLGHLFQMDHLATRMRRNNENLMVLCGSTLVRTHGHRVPLEDVLRAAVSEIEHYQRAEVQPSASVEVTGYVAGDLARIIAELLDNATAFSPPETQVVVSTTPRRDGSALIEVRDQGIGMSGADLAKAHRRLEATTSEEASSSRQMGLFVVGRLANRHGISVNLSSDWGAGLLAGVLVPANLVPGNRPDEAPRGNLPRRSGPSPTAAKAFEPARPRQESGPATAAPAVRESPNGARPAVAADAGTRSPGWGGPERAERPDTPGTGPGSELPRRLPRRAPAGTDGPGGNRNGNGTGANGTGRPGPVGKDAPEESRNGPPPLPSRPSAHDRAPADGPAAQDAQDAQKARQSGPGLVPPQRSGPEEQRAPRSRWFEPPASDADDAAPASAAPRPPSAGTRPPSASPRPQGSSRLFTPPGQQTEPLPGPGPARTGESATDQAADRRPGGSAEPSDTQEGADRTQSGLPKRTPRSPRPGGRAEPRTGPGKAKPSQDAGSTHSFLSNYQSGIRRARPDER